MAKTLKGLAGRMERLKKQIPKESGRLARETAIAVIVDLLAHTPVDTSLALSNWQLHLNTPIMTAIQAYAKGKFGSTAHTSYNAALAEALRELKSHKSGDTIWIINLIRYIVYLNQGHSSQEPAQFVERAVDKGRMVISTLKMKL